MSNIFLNFQNLNERGNFILFSFIILKWLHKKFHNICIEYMYMGEKYYLNVVISVYSIVVQNLKQNIKKCLEKPINTSDFFTYFFVILFLLSKVER